MASAGTVVIELDANTAKLVKGIKTSKTKLSSLQRRARDAQKTLLNMAKAAAGFYVVTKAVDLAKNSLNSFIDTSSQFETYTDRMGAFTTSQAEANSEMQRASNFAKEWNLEIANTTDTMLILKNYGIDDSNESLKIFTNTAIGSGKSLSQYAEAVADALTGENERLKEFGVKASRIGEDIGYVWTDSSGKTRNVIIEDNKEIINSTLNAIMNEKYVGQIEKYKNSWKGLLQGVSNQWTQFKLDVADEGLLNYFKALAVTVENSLGTVFGNAGSTAAGMAQIVMNGVESMIRGAGSIYDSWNGITLVWTTIENAAFEAFVALNEARSAWSLKFSNDVVEAQNAFGSMTTGIKKLWYDMINFLGTEWNVFWTDWVVGFNKIASFVGADMRFDIPSFSPTVVAEYEKIAYAQKTVSSDTEYWNVKLAESDEELKRIYKTVENETGTKNANKFLAELQKNFKGLTDGQPALDAAKKALEDLEAGYGGLDSASKKAGKSQSKAAKDSIKDLNKWQKSALDVSGNISSSFGGMFHSMLDGDFTGGFTSMFDNILHDAVEPFIKNMSDILAEGLAEMLMGQEAYTAAVVAQKVVEGQATAAVGVANQAAGDPYTAFARMAAMAALMAGLGFATASASGGGSNDKYTPTYSQFSSGSTGSQTDDFNNSVNLDSDGIKMQLEDYNAILKLANDNQMSFNKSMEAYVDLTAEANKIWEDATVSLRKFKIELGDYQDALDATYSVGDFSELDAFFDNFMTDGEKIAAASREATYLYNILGQALPASSSAARAEVERWLTLYAATGDVAHLANANATAEAANAFFEWDELVTDAVDALKVVYASLTDIASLKADWIGGVEGAQLVLDATIAETGITGVNFDNFLAQFTAASADGLSEESMEDWNDLSGALISLNDIVDETAEAILSLKDASLKTLLDFNTTTIEKTFGTLEGYINNQDYTGAADAYNSIVSQAQNNAQLTYKEQLFTIADANHLIQGIEVQDPNQPMIDELVLVNKKLVEIECNTDEANRDECIDYSCTVGQ